jgi:cysteine desulfurase / selenocysteine lyase
MNKEDFPIFKETLRGKRLTYLDSAASAQKPLCVLQAMNDFMLHDYSNVHRGVYLLSEKATQHFEQARKTVADFINAKEDEIVFTRSATESINLVASSFGESFKEGDEIIVSIAEHHSDFVPWQQLAAKKNLRLRVVDITDEGALRFDQLANFLNEKTRLVALTQMSNLTGARFDIKKAAAMAHQAGAKLLADGCQGVVHGAQDMKDLDCDFYVFSAHKLYGPTGLGVLYGKREILEQMPPYQYGGDMVKSVTIEKTVFSAPPARFEAGTPAIVQTVGLQKAVEYVSALTMQKIEAYESELSAYFRQGLDSLPFVRQLGTLKNKGGVYSFVVQGVHPQDISMILDQEGVCVRTGHHCAQPLSERLGVSSSVRASLGLYNDKEDVDAFIAALEKAVSFFKKR